MNTFTETFRPAAQYCRSELSAASYCVSRRAEVRQLLEVGLCNLPYVRVERMGRSGLFVVDGVTCLGVSCAAAYILARFW